MASFGEAWFADALREAREPQGRDAMRREIAFAVCFAESYLYEFVPGHLFSGRYEALFKYVPSDDRRGIRDRWKEVLRNLHRDGKLKAIPDFSRERSWSEFSKLITYRDGLVRAKVSRPATSGQRDEEKPLPAPEDLDRLPAGWAVTTVVELAQSLHDCTGIPTPAWLVVP